MDELKTGIGMRAYGQRDPLIEYKREGYEMFSQLLDNIDDETIELVYKLQISRPQQDQDRLRRQQQQMETKHDDAAGMATRMAAVSETVSAGVGEGGGSRSRGLAAAMISGRGIFGPE